MYPFSQTQVNPPSRVCTHFPSFLQGLGTQASLSKTCSDKTYYFSQLCLKTLKVLFLILKRFSVLILRYCLIMSKVKCVAKIENRQNNWDKIITIDNLCNWIQSCPLILYQTSLVWNNQALINNSSLENLVTYFLPSQCLPLVPGGHSQSYSPASSSLHLASFLQGFGWQGWGIS